VRSEWYFFFAGFAPLPEQGPTPWQVGLREAIEYLYGKVKTLNNQTNANRC